MSSEDVVHPPVVERLRIAVRERPVADDDVAHVQMQLRIDEEKLVAFQPGAAEGLMYDYDYYYPASSRQEDLFRTIGLEMVEVVMGGLSTSCVTFGLADTGKTHTLFGSENEAGLMQDTVRELFARLEGQADRHEHHVSLQYWEMSRDDVLDNLGSDEYEAAPKAKGSHSIFRDGFGRLYAANLTEVDIGVYDEFESFLNAGHSRRIQRGRDRHSRWHGFVQLSVTTTDRARGELCVLRQMTFVHLKGPDRAGEKGARGQWLHECSTINVSVTLLCAGVIHSLQYRQKRAAQVRTKEALHELIRRADSFFMECRFSQMMAQLMSGHEACFVIGCVNPLQYGEAIDTLENLQLFRQLTCACGPVVTSSEKGRLMRKLARLEQAYGGTDVLDLVYNDTTGRPVTEEEEELRRLRRTIDNWGRDGADGPGARQEAQRHEEELKQRSRARLGRTQAAAAAQRTAATHGDRNKINLNAVKTATYEGQWANGSFDGFGEHIQTNFKYRGEFSCGKREGEGTLFIREAPQKPYHRIYQGEWLAGKRDGRGTQWVDNGDVYEGDFSADQRHGNGKLYLTNGDVVAGGFANGSIEGWAVLAKADGDWFEGYWSQGMREGPGIWHYVHKKQNLKGEWANNIAVMGVYEDDDDKEDDSCSGFIPRVSLLNFEEILVRQRDKLNERRTRDFAATGHTWVDHAAAAAAAAGPADGEGSAASALEESFDGTDGLYVE